MSDQKLAFWWHTAEIILIALLLLSVVGWGWSWQHLKPRFVETRRPLR